MRELYTNTVFVRLLAGRLVTNAGDSIYNIAAMWLIHELTGSTVYTGLAGALFLTPQALQFLTGPIVDEYAVRRLLVVTQLVQGIGVLLIPLLAYTGHLSVWAVIGLIPVLAFLNQFVYPAQNSVLPQVVTEDELVHANSLFTFSHQGANLLFNAVGGVLIGLVGAITIYIVNSITFFFALVLFAGVVVPKPQPVEAPADAQDESDTSPSESNDESVKSAARKYVRNMKDGFRYLRGSVVVPILIISTIPNLGFGLMTAVLPALADSLGGAGALGLLTAAVGGGNLTGSALASKLEDVGFGVLSIVGSIITGSCWLLVTAVDGLVVTAALFFTAFVPIGVHNVIYWSLLQSAVDDSMLGRVTSVASSSSTLLMPVGSLLGGTAASYFGVGFVIGLMATSVMLAAGAYLISPKLRTLPAPRNVDQETLEVS